MPAHLCVPASLEGRDPGPCNSVPKVPGGAPDEPVGFTTLPSTQTLSLRLLSKGVGLTNQNDGFFAEGDEEPQSCHSCLN